MNELDKLIKKAIDIKSKIVSDKEEISAIDSKIDELNRRKYEINDKSTFAINDGIYEIGLQVLKEYCINCINNKSNKCNKCRNAYPSNFEDKNES